MLYDHMIIRYGELALKGKNRTFFINKLKRSIVNRLKGVAGQATLELARDRMFINLNDADPHEVMQSLVDVFGIHSMSLAAKSTLTIDGILETADALFKEQIEGKSLTFKVTTKRSFKGFTPDSQKMNAIVGGHLLKNNESVSVNVHHPDIEVRVEIRHNAAYISCGVVKGAGGFPAGTSGKAMLMLSGGIDSPVAAYMAMRRGLSLEAIHFFSPPYTSERAKQKVISLAKELRRFGNMKLHIVPFTEIQETIQRNVAPDYTMTITRRMMLRIAERLAEKRKALSVVTGENLGQVASQTLESMYTIGEVTDLPLLRPLLTMDKVEIMDKAREIGTYDVSILPYEDCCTVFLPPAPKTKPRRSQAAFYEEKLDIDKLVDDALAQVELVSLKQEKADEFSHFL
ncbi:tRNA 4-thiouridine(8) synthase ThiI [Bacillaceae bacterium SIJ1]|uniref:tRNA uracil 4-sulfurtransferase ThiI n=1 Tax=Litoribacterium kuwaitense TaxID=1398745 RepID=UPI0013ED5C52|nr:tRNA uracil 4-sulfurtransferase ThiI [Litoribacterium kuwaitense]NGP44179.1 tRNA 4-thiouridine(8) synthase ThiI [Litoribacterium kuwaitense]